MKAASTEKRNKAVRVLALGTFTVLLILGRLGFWAIALALGLVMEAVKPGRVYCMRLCPIRAAHGLSGRSPGERKGGAPLRRTESIKILGRAYIAAFLVLFGISLVLGLRGWLFPAFLAIGGVLSLALSLPTLCSTFCPFGAAFVLVRRISAGFSGLFRKR